MNIKIFEVRKVIDGNEVVLHPTLVEINNKKFLVDCGYEETFNEFISGMATLGTAVSDLHAILISHDDIDHLGALSLFKSVNPGLIVYCSAVEEDSVIGKVKSERLQQAETSLPTLPDEYKAWALRFIDQLRSIKRIKVDAILNDGDNIERELRVMATPGHTKGHISFYALAENTLIANDAIVFENGKFDIANPAFTLDMKQAIESVKKIRDMNPEKIICYHGGLVDRNLEEQLDDLIDKYS